jgi:AraC-like DNA-binding protein
MSKGSLRTTLPWGIVDPMVEMAKQRGMKPEISFSVLGFSGGQDISPETPLSTSKVLVLWETIMRNLGEDGFPIEYANSLDFEKFPVFGLTIMTSASVRDALLRTVRYGNLVTRSASWTMAETPQSVEMQWHREGDRTLGLRVANESAIAQLLKGVRQTVGHDIQPLLVSFMHKAPRNLEVHTRFFKAPIQWSSGKDSIEFSPSLLTMRPILYNKTLSEVFLGIADNKLSQEDATNSLSLKLRALVENQLASGEPDIASVASTLGMSERTLRRMLEEQGTSYREIVKNLRLDLAKSLLKDPKITTAEIAFRLGFSEPSAFSRAYKNWVGSSPRRTTE